MTAENIVVGSGAKPFEQFFAEAVLDPGDGVLVFSPQFPTYVPNLERRGARAVLVPLKVENEFRPSAEDVGHFLATDPKPRAILLNSPHNPTGGVATRDDLAAIAEVVRGTELMVFSDEPYCHMVWSGRHASILAEPGMLEHTVAAYTFSKSYSMSGWRIGFAVAAPAVVDAIGKLINTIRLVQPSVGTAGRPGGPGARHHDPRRLHGTIPPQGRPALRRPGACRRLPCRAPGRNVLCLPGRASGLQPLANHLARPGALSAGRGRRPLRRGLPGRRVFRRGRPGLLAVQLRRARRAHRPGHGVSTQGDRSRSTEFVGIWRRIRSMCFISPYDTGVI